MVCPNVAIIGPRGLTGYDRVSFPQATFARDGADDISLASFIRNRQRRGKRLWQVAKSTRETDLAFARLVAAKLNEDAFKRKQLPGMVPEKECPVLLRKTTGELLAYLEILGRTYEHLKNLRGRHT